MSQNATVLRWLRKGRTLTAMQALQWWGVFRLAARCQNLRDAGHPTRSRLVHRQGKKFAEYWMPEEHWL